MRSTPGQRTFKSHPPPRNCDILRRYKTINSNAELASEIESAKAKPVVIAVLADHNGDVAQQFFTAAQDDTSGAVFLIASPGSVTDGVPATDSITMKVGLLLVPSAIAASSALPHARGFL